jgi:hypothetical protein
MKSSNKESSADSFNHLRLIAISATVPNVADIALWLRDTRDNQPAVIKVFGDEYRPVPIKLEVIGVQSNNGNAFAFDTHLNFKLFDVLKRFGDGKPALIFCSTRKSCSSSAEQMVKDLGQSGAGKFGPNHPFVASKRQYDLLLKLGKDISDPKLRGLNRIFNLKRLARVESHFIMRVSVWRIVGRWNKLILWDRCRLSVLLRL